MIKFRLIEDGQACCWGYATQEEVMRFILEMKLNWENQYGSKRSIK